MTNNLDLVKSWLDVPVNDVEGRDVYLAEEFQLVDDDGNVLMNKAAWTGMSHLLNSSFNDLAEVVSEIRAEGDSVIITLRLEGTHTGDLDLSAMGFGVIPASGKKIVWPDSSNKVTVEGGKVIRLEPYGESAGIEGFLAALGVEAPST